MNGGALLLGNLSATLFLTGLIWFFQVVHLPLTLRRGESEFPDFVRESRRRNTILIAPVMTIEAITAVWLAFQPVTRTIHMLLAESSPAQAD